MGFIFIGATIDLLTNIVFLIAMILIVVLIINEIKNSKAKKRAVDEQIKASKEANLKITNLVHKLNSQTDASEIVNQINKRISRTLDSVE